MNLKIACNQMLDQMVAVIEQIDDTDFVKPSTALSGSSIGQHFRHAIEFFECLSSGYDQGMVCYDHRDHDKNIETSTVLAIDVILRIKSFIERISLDKKLKLEVSYQANTNESQIVDSNIAREIVYNIEHVVHHMALVKVGIKELIPGLPLPEGFGVAASTIKYHKSQA